MCWLDQGGQGWGRQIDLHRPCPQLRPKRNYLCLKGYIRRLPRRCRSVAHFLAPRWYIQIGHRQSWPWLRAEPSTSEKKMIGNFSVSKLTMIRAKEEPCNFLGVPWDASRVTRDHHWAWLNQIEWTDNMNKNGSRDYPLQTSAKKSTALGAGLKSLHFDPISCTMATCK